ncbi:MAG: phasin family protein [Erythrobacter sp.]
MAEATKITADEGSTPAAAPAAKPAAPVSKIDAAAEQVAAEKAYAEAASKVVAAPKGSGKAPEANPKPEAAAPVKAEPVKAAPAKPAAKKAAPAKKPTPAKKVAAKPAATKTAAKKPAVKKPAAKKPAAKAAKTASAPVTTITKLKDTIMATAKKTDLTTAAKEMAADVQTRVKDAYAKTTELASDVTDFQKGNVEAVVESGKIFFAGAQEIVKDDVDTTKTVFEVVTADAKKMMEVKSPTDLMQMQGEIVRRNFDAIVSFGSKRTEAWLKLYNEAFAPISNRVSIAAEKITKAA